jgi:hypothetical protein
MRIAIVLAVFAVAAPAHAEESPRNVKPSKMALICKKFTERTSGLTRICYYDCGGTERAMTAQTYEPCPRWTPRWRLNRTGPFGPSGISR